jgi:hypothetical protein
VGGGEWEVGGDGERRSSRFHHILPTAHRPISKSTL